jgi:hypothetical protein
MHFTAFLLSQKLPSQIFMEDVEMAGTWQCEGRFNES